MPSLIYAIAGPSGSGKTTLAHALHRRLGAQDPNLDVAIITEDAYYRDQGDVDLEIRRRVNYDHPDALEHELLVEHLEQLRAGNAVTVPEYDYHYHTRRKEVRHLHPPSILIVEGILLLSNPQLRKHFDFSVFIDTSLSVCLERRILRDSTERGRSPEFVRDQFEATVRPMYHQYVMPSRVHADWMLGEDFEAEAVIRRLAAMALEHISADPDRER